MEYTINRLAKLAGVSARTLRYYEEVGLMKPSRISSNGYRIYGRKEVDLLQQILFYRELDLPLDEIKRIMCTKDFDRAEALKSHHQALLKKRAQLDLLIANVEKSMQAMKGEVIMSDEEKFEGFKKQLIDDNEAKYDEAVDKSNAKLMGMTKEQYAQLEALTAELNEKLKAAFLQGDPASELAQEVCRLHKQWLCFYWPSYSKEAHMGVAQMYVDDPRFTAYYDKIAPGCAAFLRDAVNIFCR